jgi:hypothetical protein
MVSPLNTLGAVPVILHTSNSGRRGRAKLHHKIAMEQAPADKITKSFTKYCIAT